MKKKRVIILCIIAIMITQTKSINVYAHPGRTDSSGCHTCKTNCTEKYDIPYGDYHCHNEPVAQPDPAPYVAPEVVEPTPTPSPEPVPYVAPVPEKSSNLNIKSTKINGKETDLSKTPTIKTDKDSITIDIVPEDSKSTVSIVGATKLKEGENSVNIKIVAENASEKNYTIIVTREVKSNSLEAIIMLNGSVIKFNSKKEYTTKVKNDINSLDLKYEVKDKKTKVYFYDNNDFKDGENKVKIEILADDGSILTNYIIVDKEVKKASAFTSILFLGMFGGVGYYIYKKKKVKNRFSK